MDACEHARAAQFAEAGPERAVVDRAQNLQKQVGAPSRGICRPLETNNYSCTCSDPLQAISCPSRFTTGARVVGKKAGSMICR